MSPVDSILPSYGLKLGDLPIEPVAPHGNQKLRGSVHRMNGTTGNIITQGPVSGVSGVNDLSGF